jgi:hypothetical protein
MCIIEVFNIDEVIDFLFDRIYSGEYSYLLKQLIYRS